jgi:hypothetical protein
MEKFGRIGRHEEHSSGQATGLRQYRKLFEVVIKHGYYNRSEDHLCPDLQVFPNRRSELLMEGLGMLFQRSATGCSVFYDDRRQGGLTHFLSKNVVQREDKTEQRWNYLSLFFAPQNPYFLNITEIPFDLRPLEHNYYFRNDAVEEIAAATPDEPSSALLRQDKPFRVMPARFPIWFPAGTQPVIRTAADEVKYTLPSVKEVDPEGPTGPSSLSPYTTIAKDKHGISSAHVDLSTWYEGRYILEGASFDPQIKGTPGPLNFIYTVVKPVPLCYAHILFNAPFSGKPGIYPVHFSDPGDPTTAEVTCRRFVVEFAARQTRWVYYIVPRLLPSAASRDLKIESEGKGPAFDGPFDVTLPNGARAYQFIARDTLPLQERSSAHLQLTGRGGEVLIRRLPVASAEQVLGQTLRPPSGLSGFPKGTVFSDIFVHI